VLVEERQIARRVIILRLFPPLFSLDRWVRARSIEPEKEKEKENEKRVDHRTSASEKTKHHSESQRRRGET
jgi:hypothetical protein